MEVLNLDLFCFKFRYFHKEFREEFIFSFELFFMYIVLTVYSYYIYNLLYVTLKKKKKVKWYDCLHSDVLNFVSSEEHR